jgi:hypothetical protein
MAGPNYEILYNISNAVKKRKDIKAVTQHLTANNSQRLINRYNKMNIVSDNFYNTVLQLINIYAPIAAGKGRNYIISYNYNTHFKIDGFLITKLLVDTDTFSTIEFDGDSTEIPATRVPVLTRINNDLDSRFDVTTLVIGGMNRIKVSWTTAP